MFFKNFNFIGVEFQPYLKRKTNFVFLIFYQNCLNEELQKLNYPKVHIVYSSKKTHCGNVNNEHSKAAVCNFCFKIFAGAFSLVHCNSGFIICVNLAGEYHCITRFCILNNIYVPNIH